MHYVGTDKRRKEREVHMSFWEKSNSWNVFVVATPDVFLHQTQNRNELFVEAIQNNPFRSSPSAAAFSQIYVF